MSEGVFTVRIAPEKRQQLDVLAQHLDRSRNYIVNRAIEEYLDTHAWQVEQIMQGFEEARRGEFLSDGEMDRIFNRYKPEDPKG